MGLRTLCVLLLTFSSITVHLGWCNEEEPDTAGATVCQDEEEGECEVIATLPPQEAADQIFAEYDEDQSGTLTLPEMEQLNLTAPYAYLLKIFDSHLDGFDIVDFPNFLGAYDSSADGQLDKSEFLYFLQTAADFSEAFDLLDRDKSNTLSVSEVRRLNPDPHDSDQVKESRKQRMEVLGFTMFDINDDFWLTENEANRLQQGLDENSNGRVEFVEALSLKARLSSALHQVSQEIVDAAATALEDKQRTLKEKKRQEAMENLPDPQTPSRAEQAPTAEEVRKLRAAVEENKRQRRMHTRRNIPTPSGRKLAEQLAKGQDQDKPTTEDQLRHFLTPTQIKIREQQKRKEELRRREERTQKLKESRKPQSQSKKISEAASKFAARAKAAHDFFNALDKDQNNAISHAELATVVTVDFGNKLEEVLLRIDLDHNGAVEVEEFKTFLPVIKTQLNSKGQQIFEEVSER